MHFTLFGDTRIPYRTEKCTHFWGLMNSATKFRDRSSLGRPLGYFVFSLLFRNICSEAFEGHPNLDADQQLLHAVVAVVQGLGFRV